MCLRSFLSRRSSFHTTTVAVMFEYGSNVGDIGDVLGVAPVDEDGLVVLVDQLGIDPLVVVIPLRFACCWMKMLDDDLWEVVEPVESLAQRLPGVIEVEVLRAR